MLWIILAVAAHVSNALVFAVDKGILGAGSQISSPGRYAALSGIAAIPVALILLLVPRWPSGIEIGWSLVAGACWVAALWCYFAALARGEATRVVPLTGASVAVATLGLAAVVLNESLAPQQWLATTLLVVGTIALSLQLRDVQRLPLFVLGLALGAGVLFASYFVLVKFLLDAAGSFWAPFAYARLSVGLWAAGLWVLLARRRGRRLVASRRSHRTGAVATAFVVSKGLALAALVAQHYAIALGNVAVVNALQGTQYVFLLGLAAVLSLWRPGILREELTRVALVQKVIGMGLIGIGLVLLV